MCLEVAESEFNGPYFAEKLMGMAMKCHRYKVVEEGLDVYKVHMSEIFAADDPESQNSAATADSDLPSRSL